MVYTDDDGAARFAKTLPPVQQTQTILSAQNLRIEALRAAATVLAGLCASGQRPLQDGRPMDAQSAALGLAEQFAAWLETGER